MNRIQRENQPTEHFICLPLDVPKAAAVLQKRFTPAQLNELVRRLHWRCPDCHPPFHEHEHEHEHEEGEQRFGREWHG